MRKLVLASTSPYRRELLSRLLLDFDVSSPNVDEIPSPGESPDDLVRRLASAKARAVAAAFPGALLIGSDQVAVLDGEVMGKPDSEAVAIRQLQRASGNDVTFLTGICLLDAISGECQLDAIAFGVRFRRLSDREIHRYVEREQPLDCAGGIKSEGLGVALFEAMHGDDPTALIGLPLIRLCSMLRKAGLDPLEH